MTPSLTDLLVDHLKNHNIRILPREDGTSYLEMNGHLIGQIVGDQVRFAPIHLRAAGPSFFIKLNKILECFELAVMK